MPVDVSQRTNQIRHAVYGKDVRENIAGGIEDIAGEMNNYEENMDQKESTRKTAEIARQNNEDTRQENEQARETNESNRVAAENNRANEFNTIKNDYETATHDNTVLELTQARTDNVNNKTYENLQARLDDTSSQMAEKGNIKQTNDTSIKLNQSIPYLNVLNAKAKTADMNNIINAVANGGMSENLLDNSSWASESSTDISVSVDNNVIVITGISGAIEKHVVCNIKKSINLGKEYRLILIAKSNDLSKPKNFWFESGGIEYGVTNYFNLTSDFQEYVLDFEATANGVFNLCISSTQFSQNEIMTIGSISLQELYVNPNELSNNLVVNGYAIQNVNMNIVGVSTAIIVDNNIEITAVDNATEFQFALKENLKSGKVYKITYTAKTSLASGSPAKRFSFKNGGTTVGASTYVPLSTDFKTYEEYVQLTADGNPKLFLHTNINFAIGEIMTISELKVEEVQEIEGNNSLYMLPRPVIWDTDWWTDCDDVMAARILLWAERARLIDIVCITMDACQDNSVPSLDAFLTSEGRPGIPIGIDHSAIDYGGTPPYQQNMLNYPHSYQSSADAEDAVHMYRRALASSTQKIDIICVGYTNNLSNLLQSPADDISALTGLQLVTQKVNKLWLMAGYYPNGSENNFARNTRSRQAGAYVCANWPTPITFLGWEAGNTVISGAPLKNYAPNDMVTKALADHGSSNGRSSWDPMLTLLACYGDLETAGYDSKKGTVSVDSSTGVNTFVFNDSGKHEYVRKMYSDAWYENKINNIIMPTYVIGSNQISK
jgi:hypothetical protein